MVSWRENTGKCPTRFVGTDKRVMVRLRRGTEAGPWKAWGRGAVLWDMDGSYPFEVTHWRPADESDEGERE